MIKVFALWRTVKQGGKYHRLTVLGKLFRLRGSTGVTAVYAVCKCKCGKVICCRTAHIESKQIKSCGCWKDGIASRRAKARATHRQSKTPLYRLWTRIKERCGDLGNKNYGGRGIGMFKAWEDDFSVFRNWALSHGYRPGLQIDRFPNNDGNYEPGNCRFVTGKINSNNKRTNRVLQWNGEKKTVTGWAEDKRCAVCMNTFKGRILAGWHISRAMTAPSRNHGGGRK